MPPPPPPPSRRNNNSSSNNAVSTTNSDGSRGAYATAKEENIYIPSFISKRPFYAGEGGDEGTTDYLEHQRKKQQDDDDRANANKWYDRGKKLGPAATKYRKGACENCGAMTHKTKECLSRPRAKGARWTGRDIQADEVVQDVRLGWDAKRDRWNGYDPKEYRRVVERYNQVEELRNQLTTGGGGDGAKKGGGGNDDADDDNDDGRNAAGEKYAEESDMGRHQSTATRQLRLREDTAKYLLNLDLESAKYDPKTRTMVDAGAVAADADRAAQLFAEEGFLRASGDAEQFERAQRYAWEKQEREGDTSQHLQANPTAGEYFRKKEREEAARQREAQRRALEEKYGLDGAGAGKNKPMPDALRDMLVTESEAFHEYDEAGLIKGAPRAVARSKYAEDVYLHNHTSVWGSWWSDFRWGYACCHSFIKKSYCTGEEGKRAWEQAERQRTGVGLIEEGPGGEEREEQQQQVNDGTTVEEAEPLKPAAAATAKKRTAEEMMGGVTEADMEEYRKKKAAADDPMAKFLGRDELVR